MEKLAREELIAALVTDKYSGFKEEDTSMLQGASDERLEAFRTAADASRTVATDKARLESDHRQTAARLKVAEDKVKASEAELTEEEFIRRAPAKIRKTLEALAAEEAELKASLVDGLKSCGADTEEELKKLSVPELKKLAKYARIEVRDYSGKGLPRETFAEDAFESLVKPPNPYDEGLKALKAQVKH